MKKLSILAAVLTGAFASLSANATEKATPYVDGGKFLEIKDVNRQAEAWATCAAIYDLMAESLTESKPARSRHLKELANGAKIAVSMTIVSDGFSPDITQERFNALWSMAKLLGTELPNTRRTILAADYETSTGKSGEFLMNVSETMKICLNNLEGQQMYIDLWREFAKSGLLKLQKD